MSFRLTTALAADLPDEARSVIGAAAGVVSYAVMHRQRRAARRQLGLLLGQRPPEGLVLREFVSYGRLAVEFLWVQRLAAAAVWSRAEVAGKAHLDAAVAGGRGVVLALFHQGNWDIAGAVAAAAGYRLLAVAAPVGPPAVDALVVRARARMGVETVGPRRAARGVLRAVRQGRPVALLVDLAGESERRLEVEAGGLRVRLPEARMRLLARTAAPVLPVTTRRLAPGRFRVVIGPPVRLPPGPGGSDRASDDAQSARTRALAEALARALLAAARADPGQWYPFRPVIVGLPRVTM